MKKLSLILIFCMIFCIPVFAEPFFMSEIKPSQYTEQDFDKSGDVTFTTEQSVYPKDVKEITYIFENHTSMCPSYGFDVELEIFVSQQWYQIPLYRDIDDVAMNVNPNEKREDNFRWNIEGYDLPEGKYRIIQELDDMAYGQLGPFGKRKYYAEFEIEKSQKEISPSNGRILWNGMGLKPSEYTEQDFEKNGNITLTTEHSVYGKDIQKIAYIFENHTTTRVMYGEDAELEVFLNGKWYQIYLNRFINSIGYVFGNGKSGNVFYWDTEGYDLPEGKYRLIKELSDKKYYAEFEIGNSIYTENTPYGYKKLNDLPAEYSKDMAIKNNDVVFIEGGEQENTEKITEFIEKIKLGIPTFLRITRYLKNGDVIITDIEHTDNYIYRCDMTRTKNNTGITGKEYPYLITDENNVYLSNWASLLYQQKYQGEIGQYLFSKANGENATTAIKEIESMTEKQIQENSTEYKVENKEIYFNGENATEQIIKEEQKKGHQAVKVLEIKWYDEQNFLVKVKADDEEYTILYQLKDNTTKNLQFIFGA